MIMGVAALEDRSMAILSKPVGIAMAAVIGIAPAPPWVSPPPVLTGAAAYGDWRSDAPDHAGGHASALRSQPPPQHRGSSGRRVAEGAAELRR
jgi:hypothetical protein